jgi:hypothetical protein
MLSNTATIEDQPITFAEFSVEKRHAEPFGIADGRYVGQDGFVVPKDFDEFHERFPQYVRNWVRKHSDRFAQPEDVEDWTHDLLIHLKWLPPTSKYREAGKKDIVQTFDPARHYGANQRRFQNYINLCLANKFNTMYAARMRNPLCRTGNLSLSGHVDGEDWGAVNDEYCHTHSEHLRNAAERLEKQWQDRQRIVEFTHFVSREESGTLPAIGAIRATGSHSDTAEFLGITDTEFTRMRTRLRQLGGCFVNGEGVPRQRRSYKKRRKAAAIRNLAAAA